MDCLTLKKSNCKNCYKCIRHCPVKSIRFSGNQAYIIGNECILCGQCFVVCPQDAKQIVDETEKVKVLLHGNEPVYVSLAPSFIANYRGIGIDAMRAALQQLGFADVEETAVGATIVKNEYERMVDEGLADAVLTFDELTAWLKAENIALQPELDSEAQSRARFFPTTGGILKTLSHTNPHYTYMAVDGVENCIAALRDIESGQVHRCFIEMSACAGSCIGGPVMEKFHRSPVQDYAAVAQYAGVQDFPVAQPEETTLRKEFVSIEHKLATPSEEEIRDVLRQMGKMKPSQELNCGSCGYDSCREKAIAVCQGKAEISMCLPYLKDKAESFSDTIVRNTPNGLIVLNEKLEVQQINKAAQKILNIRYASDILGDQVVRILEPGDFLTVLSKGKAIHNKRTYLAEYDKYVEETIVYDREYRLLVCILRDVTEEESQREKKEHISRQTVEIADRVVDKQMRIVQEIASLLGETAAETKIALSKLKESIQDE